MTRGTEEKADRAERASKRAVVYCLVPGELAERLHEPLRKHFAGDPGVEVVVERRRRERRSGEERRRTLEANEDEVGEPERDPAAPGREGAPGREAEDAPSDDVEEAAGTDADERRQVLGPAGRRAGERRARVTVLSGADAPELPRRARRYAKQLTFVRRLEPAGERTEDVDSARVVVRFQAGDREAFGTLYTRYFSRIYGYMKVALRDVHEAEDAAQQVFAEAFEALPRYERRGNPFRAWLFTIARHVAIKHHRRIHRIDLPGDEELDRLREENGGEEEPEVPALDWIRDPDLLLFVERLPHDQGQVLALRYVLGLTYDEIAEALGRSPEAVRMQHSRAVRFLRKRLAAVGKAPEGKRRQTPSLAPISQAKVVRLRRFSLTDPGPAR